MPVDWSEQSGDAHDDDDEKDLEEKYKLFIKISWNSIMEYYCASMRGDNSEGGDGNGNKHNTE